MSNWLVSFKLWFASLSTLEVLMLLGIVCIVILIIYVRIATVNIILSMNENILNSEKNNLTKLYVSSMEIDGSLREVLITLQEIQMPISGIEDMVGMIDKKNDGNSNKNKDPYGLEFK